MEAEKEELSEEIAALQQERDEGLLLAESEKQQVCESGWPLRLSWLCPASPHTAAGAKESASFFLGLSFLTCRVGELEA